jgi:hypothetical protein
MAIVMTSAPDYERLIRTAAAFCAARRPVATVAVCMESMQRLTQLHPFGRLTERPSPITGAESRRSMFVDPKLLEPEIAARSTPHKSRPWRYTFWVDPFGPA